MHEYIFSHPKAFCLGSRELLASYVWLSISLLVKTWAKAMYIYVIYDWNDLVKKTSHAGIPKPSRKVLFSIEIQFSTGSFCKARCRYSSIHFSQSIFLNWLYEFVLRPIIS